MNSVSQVNNLAQFMNLVSAARTRNSGLVNGAVHNAAQSPRPMAFQNVVRSSGGMAAYSNTRQVVKNAHPFGRRIEAPAGVYAEAAPAEQASKPQQGTRTLGTKFDAYA